MKHICKQKSIIIHPLIEELFTKQTLFFDIETTGFSSNNCIIYLIGCMRIVNNSTGNTIIIDQFFAEKKEDEPKILKAFLALFTEETTLISFNGLRFDMPFIKTRCQLYFNLNDLTKLNDTIHFDIFHQIQLLLLYFL